MGSKQPPGRKPLEAGQRSANIHAVVSPADFDRAYRRAEAQGVSLSAFARDAIRRASRDEDDDAADD